MEHPKVRIGGTALGWLLSTGLTVSGLVVPLAGYTLLALMLPVSVWTFWPWIKRWRPFTLAPPNGSSLPGESRSSANNLQDSSQSLTDPFIDPLPDVLVDQEPKKTYYKGETVHISSLAWMLGERKNSILTLKGFTFDNCVIYGPAVVVPMNTDSFGGQNFVGDCSWNNLERARYWRADPQDQEHYAGVVGLEDCIFRACRFLQVGVLVDAEEYERLGKDVTDL